MAGSHRTCSPSVRVCPNVLEHEEDGNHENIIGQTEGLELGARTSVLYGRVVPCSATVSPARLVGFIPASIIKWIEKFAAGRGVVSTARGLSLTSGFFAV